MIDSEDQFTEYMMGIKVSLEDGVFSLDSSA